MSSRDERFSTEQIKIVCLLLAMVNVILVSRGLGLEGAGYFAVSTAMTALICGIMSGWISGFVYRYVKGRNTRNQYRSSVSFYRGALICNFFFSMLLCLFVWFGKNMLARLLVGDTSIGLCFIVMAPMIPLYGIGEVLSGYLRGMGLHVPVKIFLFVRTIVVFAGSLLGMKWTLVYGEKVALLLRNESVSYVYGAFGAIFGVLLGQIIGILVLIVFLFLYRGEIHRLKMMDTGRHEETIVHGFMKTLVKGILSGLRIGLVLSPLFLDFILYVKKTGTGSNLGLYMKNGGILFGLAIPVCVLFLLLFGMMNMPSYKGLISYVKIDDYSQIRERVSGMLMGLFGVLLPIVLGFAVLYDPLSEVLCPNLGAEQKQCFLYCLIIAVSGSMLYIWMHMISLWREDIILLGIGITAFVVQTLFVTAGLAGSGASMQTIFIGTIIGQLSFIVLCILRLHRRLHLSVVLWKNLLMLTMVAAISALVTLLIYNVACKSLPMVVGILVALLPGLILYFGVVGFLRLVDVDVAENMPGGVLFLIAARALNRY